MFMTDFDSYLFPTAICFVNTVETQNYKCLKVFFLYFLSFNRLSIGMAFF